MSTRLRPFRLFLVLLPACSASESTSLDSADSGGAQSLDGAVVATDAMQTQADGEVAALPSADAALPDAAQPGANAQDDAGPDAGALLAKTHCYAPLSIDAAPRIASNAIM